MHVYEVILGIYNFISQTFFNTYSTDYLRKQQNEAGYFDKMQGVKARTLSRQNEKDFCY